jgi:uncharacterized protein YuzE
MKIEYFPDTDTLLLEFSARPVADTRDLNENTLVEFDTAGRLVSMTIEHACEQANVSEFIFTPAARAGRALSHVAEEGEEYKTRTKKGFTEGRKGRG